MKKKLKKKIIPTISFGKIRERRTKLSVKPQKTP